MRLRTLLTCAALVAACTPAEPLRLESAWLRAPVPGRSMTAGYFVLVNEGPTARVLVRADSPAAERIELHTHESDGAMMRMRRLEELPVPAGSRVAFRPGSHHLMVFGLRPGSGPIPVTLGFADGSAVTGQFEVRALPGPSEPRATQQSDKPSDNKGEQ